MVLLSRTLWAIVVYQRPGLVFLGACIIRLRLGTATQCEQSVFFLVFFFWRQNKISKTSPPLGRTHSEWAKICEILRKLTTDGELVTVTATQCHGYRFLASHFCHGVFAPH